VLVYNIYNLAIDPPSKVKRELSIGCHNCCMSTLTFVLKLGFVIKIKLIFLGVIFSSPVHLFIYLFIYFYFFESTSWAPSYYIDIVLVLQFYTNKIFFVCRSFNFIHMVWFFSASVSTFLSRNKITWFVYVLQWVVFQDFLSYKTKVYYVFYVFQCGCFNNILT